MNQWNKENTVVEATPIASSTPEWHRVVYSTVWASLLYPMLKAIYLAGAYVLLPIAAIIWGIDIFRDGLFDFMEGWKLG